MVLGSVCMRNVSTSVSSNLRVGPSARNLLMLYGLEANVVPATGAKNVLLKSDLLKYINQNNLKPRPLNQLMEESLVEPPVQVGERVEFASRKASGAMYMDLEVNSMRKTIAKRLTLSKTTIPHAYMTSSCNVDSLQKLRSSLKKEGHKVSLNDMLIKTIAASIRKVPQVNGIWDEKTYSMKLINNIDISIAVATESGLITPIIKSADVLSVVQVNELVKQLAEKARTGMLKPEEFQGGTFTVSNLGMFGITNFSAVINPPQAAILAIGGIKVGLNQDHLPTQAIDLTLSYDSRCISQDTAAEFMIALKEITDNPTMGIV